MSSGSNQVYSNKVRRYFPLKKSNNYIMSADLPIADVTPVQLQFNLTTLNEIGAGLSYAGGVFTVLDESAEGMYTFDMVLVWAANSNNFRESYFIKGVSSLRRGNDLEHGLTASVTVINTSITVDLRVGDTIIPVVFQNSGTNPLNLVGSVINPSNFSHLEVTLIQ